MPSTYIDIINFINSQNIYLYIIGLFVLFYIIIGLLTWNIIKPLKYIGIVHIIVGIIFMVLKLLPYSISVLYENKLLEMILPTVIKPIFIIGLYIFGSGLLMVILYRIIKKIKDKEKT